MTSCDTENTRIVRPTIVSSVTNDGDNAYFLLYRLSLLSTPDLRRMLLWSLYSLKYDAADTRRFEFVASPDGRGTNQTVSCSNGSKRRMG
jgi:hypothetical protein